MTPEEDVVLKTGTELFTDLEYYVVYEVHGYHVDYTVYPVFAMYHEDGKLDTTKGVPLVEKDMGGSPVYTIEEAEVTVTGFVKWDGCSNWDFKTSECMMHFCEREQMVQLGELLGRLYDMTAELCPHWNG